MRPRHNPGSKYKPINYARSLLVGPSQKRANNALEGQGESNPKPRVRRKGREGVGSDPREQAMFPGGAWVVVRWPRGDATADVQGEVKR